jgi:signal transduction histidine kinase
MIEQVVRLVRRPLPRGDELEPHLALLEAGAAPLPCLPKSDTPTEEAIFACATHVFLQTPQAARCLDALQRGMGGETFQHLLVFLAFVRTAHFWTKVHPELEVEDDVQRLLETHEALAECVLNDPEASACETTQTILEELHALRRERALREEMERALETDRRKTEFLAMLAHELRNPLAPISNAVEILRRSGGDEQQRKGQITEMIHRQVGQVVRLVDDLLDVSRISQGKIELRREPVELASVVHHAVEAARLLCATMGHELTVTLPPQPVYLKGDAARLAQVVGNLLNNACKFTEKGGRIRLIVEREGKQVLLRVQDTGIGIAAEQVASIFEMFTQVDTSFERPRDGLGLGLALVKSLVEMHEGTVEARSAGVGQGSEFVVRLPILAGSPQPPPKPALSTPAPTKARHILVVDDNRDSAESLAML